MTRRPHTAVLLLAAVGASALAVFLTVLVSQTATSPACPAYICRPIPAPPTSPSLTP